VAAGLLKRDLLEISRPLGMWFPVFWNQRQERFQDRRVREALWLLYDFEWINRVLLFGYYDYATSFFHDTGMSQRGLPGPAELELLEPIRELVPQRVFTEAFRGPDSRGYGPGRNNLRRALELLQQAGWLLRDGELVNERTGEPFRIEFVVVSDSLVRGLMPYMDALDKVGIRASARRLEVSNWYYRMRTRSFDAGMTALPMQNVPSISLRNYFASSSADVDFSQNWASVRDPAVDHLGAELRRVPCGHPGARPGAAVGLPLHSQHGPTRLPAGLVGPVRYSRASAAAALRLFRCLVVRCRAFGAGGRTSRPARAGLTWPATSCAACC
jgi:microcin C transport system substrate-binding protein